MVFIDLEKAYNKVPRSVMWWALEKHKVSTKYIHLIKDMYTNVVTSHYRNQSLCRVPEALGEALKTLGKEPPNTLPSV
jgi:hypothetical protein